MRSLATALILLSGFFLFAGFCTFSSCNLESPPAMNNAHFTYLALGDSYTIGEGVSASNSWPFQLTDQLKKEGFEGTVPKVIARTGWRTDHLAAAIEEEGITAKYDLVSLQIGVNNQFQGKDIEVYKKELRGLINTSIGLCAKGKSGVFVLSIPDYGSTPFGKVDRVEIGKEIDQWNAVCKSICGEFEVPFLDITPLSKKGASDASLVAKDGLHPSAKMYALWVDEIAAEVKKLLQ